VRAGEAPCSDMRGALGNRLKPRWVPSPVAAGPRDHGPPLV
jgi:hypothetical protein